MLDIVSEADLHELVEVGSPWSVSFYLPTHASGRAVAEGPIRLKNLIADARPEFERLDDGQVTEHADRRSGDVDLVDRIARATLEHGGTVFAVDVSEMPSDGPLAALLRY